MSAVDRRATAAPNLEQRDWNRFAGVAMALGVMYCSIATMASGQWTAQSTSTSVSTTNVMTYTKSVQMGLWQVCNCTSVTDAGYFCNAQQGLGVSHAVFSVISSVTVVAALVVVCVDAFLLVEDAKAKAVPSRGKPYCPDWLRADHIACVLYACAAVCAVVSWILAAVRYSTPKGSVCPSSTPFYGIDLELTYRSFIDAGFILHWAFGLRVVESVFIVVAAVIFGLRATGRVRGAWHVAFVVGVLVPVINIITTSANSWIGKPLSAPEPARTFGPWGKCDCYMSQSICSDIADQYRALQAFAVMRLILQVAQMVLLGLLVPLLRSRIPRIATIITPWVVWSTHLLVWTIAIGTFSGCGCHGIQQGQNLSWPFAVDLISFFVQTALGVHLSWRYLRHRLLQWALDNNPEAAAPPPTAMTKPALVEARRGEPINTDAPSEVMFDPYATPDGSSIASDESEVGGSPTNRGHSRFGVRRRTFAKDSPTDTTVAMAPRVTRSRFIAEREPLSPSVAARGSAAQEL